MSRHNNISESDIIEASSLIQEYNILFYIHTVFTINLSNPNQFNHSLVNKDLDIARKVGGRGVVVHVGKSLKMNINEALDLMEQSIRKILPFATSECPLLLETPAGQGTELCKTFDSFSSFYSRFNNDERLQICIDTCHVFASGHDPLNYIQKWNLLYPNSIKLIHYNDSMKPCGSCVDRHAAMGTGYIGYDKLLAVASFANIHKIPMVIE